MQPTITSNLLVRVDYLPGSSVRLLMSDMRTWLDHQRIQPTDFRPTTLPFGSIAFDIQFRDAHEAALFRSAFAA
jgi:hypothetical protein